VYDLCIQKPRCFLWRSGTFKVFSLPGLQKVIWAHFHDKPFSERRQDLQQWAVKKMRGSPHTADRYRIFFEITQRCRKTVFNHGRHNSSRLASRCGSVLGGANKLTMDCTCCNENAVMSLESGNKSVCDGVQERILFVFSLQGLYKNYWAHFHDSCIRKRICLLLSSEATKHIRLPSFVKMLWTRV